MERVILKLLIPVGLPSDLSPLNFLLQTDTPATVQAVQQGPTTEVLPSAGISMEPANVLSGIQDVQVQKTFNAAGNSDHATAQTTTAKGPGIDWTFVVLTVWAGGALGMGIWLAAGIARLKRLAIERGDVAGAWTQALFESCQKEMGTKRPIRLILQSYLSVPAITGICRPVMFLPAALVQEQNEEKLRCIFFTSWLITNAAISSSRIC